MAAKTCTSSQFLSIKGLVWAHRCLGMYCLKKTSPAAATDTMELSLPLLLWTIFLKATQISITLFLGIFFEEYETWDVGSLSAHLNIIMATVFQLLEQISILCNGRILYQILLECEEDARPKESEVVCGSVTVFSMERIMTVLFYCSYVVLFFLSMCRAWLVGEKNGEYVIMFVFFPIGVGSMMLTAMLFREVLTIAAKKLSVDFPLDSSFLEGGLAGDDPRLDALEKRIRKVSHRNSLTISPHSSILYRY